MPEFSPEQSILAGCLTYAIKDVTGAFGTPNSDELADKLLERLRAAGWDLARGDTTYALEQIVEAHQENVSLRKDDEMTEHQKACLQAAWEILGRPREQGPFPMAVVTR